MFLRETAEFRTFFLITACYSAIAVLILNPLDIPLIAQMVLLIPLITLHSSLQHELMHGHPFKSQRVNDLLAMVPVGLFVCYYRFKESHLKHHNDRVICDPYEDPESWYLTKDSWHQKPTWLQNLLQFNNTLIGRMLLGPAIGIIGFTAHEMKQGPLSVRLFWFLHFTFSTFLLLAINTWGNIPVWAYLICCYFGYSLLMIRTFIEHQASSSILARSVIIEKKGFFSFLFLNNNFHAVHHAYPKLAWYRIPTLFERNRDRFMGNNKNYYFKNYAEVFARFLFTVKEPVIYPLDNRTKE